MAVDVLMDTETDDDDVIERLELVCTVDSATSLLVIDELNVLVPLTAVEVLAVISVDVLTNTETDDDVTERLELVCTVDTAVVSEVTSLLRELVIDELNVLTAVALFAVVSADVAIIDTETNDDIIVGLKLVSTDNIATSLLSRGSIINELNALVSLIAVAALAVVSIDVLANTELDDDVIERLELVCTVDTAVVSEVTSLLRELVIDELNVLTAVALFAVVSADVAIIDTETNDDIIVGLKLVSTDNIATSLLSRGSIINELNALVSLIAVAVLAVVSIDVLANTKTNDDMIVGPKLVSSDNIATSLLSGGSIINELNALVSRLLAVVSTELEKTILVSKATDGETTKLVIGTDDLAKTSCTVELCSKSTVIIIRRGKNKSCDLLPCSWSFVYDEGR